MILFLTYLILLWVVNAWHDSDYYNKKDAHLSGALLSCLAVLGLFLFQFINLHIRDTWDVVNLSFVALTLRWVIFDITYNLLIGQKWYYKGSTAKLDKWLPNYVQFGLKVLFLFISIPIFVSFLNYLK